MGAENTVLFGDCRESMRKLAADGVRVQCAVTSPPYFGLRDYGTAPVQWPATEYAPMPGLPPVSVPAMACELGQEPDPLAYVGHMVDVFRALRDVLADDGVLWVNLGDSYNTAGGVNNNGKNDALGKTHRPGALGNSPGLKPKDLIGIPWRVAFALQAEGWTLRQDIIWHKQNPMPESVRDRCTKAHEYVFLLTKGPRYFWDAEAMKEICVKGAAGSEFHTGKTGDHQLGRASTKPRAAGNKTHKHVDAYEASETEEHRTKAGLMKIADVPWEKRNRRSVWTIAPKPYSGAHFAVMPPALIEPMILATSKPGDIVLDPFFGSGTTGQVAEALGRRWIGCELQDDYAPLQRARTAQMGMQL
jgi:DNA modification methylase